LRVMTWINVLTMLPQLFNRFKRLKGYNLGKGFESRD